jgi:hypothetical protein
MFSNLSANQSSFGVNMPRYPSILQGISLPRPGKASPESRSPRETLRADGHAARRERRCLRRRDALESVTRPNSAGIPVARTSVWGVCEGDNVTSSEYGARTRAKRTFLGFRTLDVAGTADSSNGFGGFNYEVHPCNTSPRFVVVHGSERADTRDRAEDALGATRRARPFAPANPNPANQND